MPLYDCGSLSCVECQRAFGDRRRATAEYFARAFHCRCMESGVSQVDAHMRATRLYQTIRYYHPDIQRPIFEAAMRAIQEAPENIGPLLRFRPAEAA